MLTLLRTGRWQGFTAVVIVAIVAFGFLSRWQWDRAEQKQIQAQEQTLSERAPTTPSLFDSPDEFTPVSLTGTYDPNAVRFVRQRPLEGRNGFWVMQQLRTIEGSVWVLRGWIPSGIRAGDSPDFDADDQETVTIAGVVRPLPEGADFDAEDRGGLPVDQVTEITTGQLPPATAANWYVQRQAANPDTLIDQSVELIPVPLPVNDDLQNISYAVQWLLFAAVAMGGWFFFLRREARDSGV